MVSSTFVDNMELNRKLQNVFQSTLQKLRQYYAPEVGEPRPRTKRFTQPGLKLLKAVRAFDLKTVQSLPVETTLADLQCLPQLNEEAVMEFRMFASHCKEIDTDIEPIRYWRAAKARFPTLSSCAIRYLSVPPGSVDAERSFSARGNILTPQRLGLTRVNRSRLTFLYVNSK